MSLSTPRDSTIAVVGVGFGSLIVYSTAVYLGFRPEEITIYGPAKSPVETYQQFAFNLGQTVLRSESESHFLPADCPPFPELGAPVPFPAPRRPRLPRAAGGGPAVAPSRCPARRAAATTRASRTSWPRRTS